MIRAITLFAMAGMLLWAVPVQAEMVQMADSDMDVISGKAHVLAGVKHSPNTVEVLGNLSSDINVTNGEGNVVVGYYQWADDHVADVSDQKGSNSFGSVGGSNQAQQNVIAQVNAISWGAYASVGVVAGTIGGDQIGESWATLYIGGF